MSSLTPRSAPSPADIALKTKLQAEYVKQLWLFLTAVIGLLTVINWSRRIVRALASPKVTHDHNRNATSGTSNETAPIPFPSGRPNGRVSIRRLPQAISSVFRVLAFRTTVPIGPSSVMSVTELTFIVGYMVALLVWLWINTNNLEVFLFEDRAARLASCQVPLIVALAGKNNIISFLTGVSHEKLNVLHRAAARACLILIWIHALIRGTTLSAYFSLSDVWMRWGVVALTAYSLAAVLSLRPIRNRFFEFFLISHIILICVFIVGGLIHAGSLNFGAYFWPAFLVWGLDRSLRLARILWNNRFWSRDSPDAHQASIELLGTDTIRLRLRRKMHWKAGQHAYVMLPSISSLPTEAHPFTIASIPDALDGSEGSAEKDVVFLIRGRSGFTGRLRNHASIKGAVTSVPAFIDGPYGMPPDLTEFSTCILIAGGSGVSYALPLLFDIIRNVRRGASVCRRVEFIWVIRDAEHLDWIKQELARAIVSAPSSLVVESRIFVTRLQKVIQKSSYSDLEKKGVIVNEIPVSSPESSVTNVTASAAAESLIRVLPGRPDVEHLIAQAVVSSQGPVSVDVAGPSSLASAVREAVGFGTSNPLAIMKGRPTVTLHVETFGMVKA